MSYELSQSAKRALQQRIVAHEDQQAEERRQQSLRDAKNAETRRAYLGNLEGLKRAKAQENDAKIDTALAPRKEQLRRQWLVDHPELQPSDFDKKAWPLLRQNLLAEREESILQATIEQGRASGMYNL